MFNIKVMFVLRFRSKVLVRKDVCFCWMNRLFLIDLLYGRHNVHMSVKSSQ